MGKPHRWPADATGFWDNKRRFLVFWLVFLTAGVLLTYHPAGGGDGGSLLAQADPWGSVQSGGDGWLSLDSWLMKAVLILIAFFAAMLFFFLVIFRWLLEKGKPWWPLTAYGFCMAAVLTVVFGVALFFFWDQLVIGSSAPPKPWWEVWGGRAGVIGGWLFVVIIVLAVFRSPHSRRAGKAAA